MLYILSSLLWMSMAQASVGDDPTYVFYLHGKIVEDMGLDAYNPQYGKYDYQAIIQALGGEGRVVISELRPKNTDINQYAEKISDEIRKLVKKGVAPHKITVIGASKGALISMKVSSILKHKEVNFIFIAGHIPAATQSLDLNLYGHILGFYELTDQIAGTSYRPLIDRSEGVSDWSEFELNTGRGHGIVFQPLSEWLDPTLKFIEERSK